MQLLDTLKAALQRLIRKKPEHPDDPYALVGAPKKPRTPLRSAAAAVEEPSE
ncbi:MAG: hypothetical protein JWO19_1826 [Bryobacterales bacterium]|jgi:hypothetical protein|nr:hypothetical protein [Bryobacterales bacterium]